MRENEGARQSEGHAQDDGERDEQTLVKGAEDEIDEDDADDEDQGCGVLRRGLLTGHATELVAVALGQHFSGGFADGLDHLAATIAVGSRSTDEDGWEEVEARERF